MKKEYRRQGLGSRLMEAALAELKGIGFRGATIGVGSDEPLNIKPYRRFGFNVKIKDCFYDSCGMDENKDIITLESALADVQYEIDMHTAALRKYDSLIGYSTFYIRLNEVAEIIEEPSVKETFGSRFVSSLKAGFADFGESMQNFALWLARNLIGVMIFAAIAVAAILICRWQIRRRKAQKNRTEG